MVLLRLVGKKHLEVVVKKRRTDKETLEKAKDTIASDVEVDTDKTILTADPAPRVADTKKDETKKSEEVHVKYERFAALNNSVN